MRNILILLLCLCLASCGVFRKVNKDKTLDKVQTTSVVKSDSTGLKIDQSTTIIKEKADTTVSTPAAVVKQDVYLNMDSLVNGMTAVQNDLLDVKLLLNPVTGILSVVANLKPQSIKLQLDRTTTKQNDITQSGTISKSAEQKHEEEHRANSVVKEPKNSIWFIVMIIGIIAVVTFGAYKVFTR